MDKIYDDALMSRAFTKTSSTQRTSQATQTLVNKSYLKFHNSNLPFVSTSEQNFAKCIFCSNMKTKHFPTNHKYHIFFSKNNYKHSYSSRSNFITHIANVNNVWHANVYLTASVLEKWLYSKQISSLKIRTLPPNTIFA